MKTRRPLLLAAFASVSTTAIGCLSGGPPEGQTTSNASETICIIDGAPCIDIPDAFAPSWPEAGIGWPEASFGGFDAGVSFTPDASYGSWPDANFSWPDANFGIPTITYCNALNPTYYTEYLQAVESATTTLCGTCSASQCCYQGLSCVAQ